MKHTNVYCKSEIKRKKRIIYLWKKKNLFFFTVKKKKKKLKKKMKNIFNFFSKKNKDGGSDQNDKEEIKTKYENDELIDRKQGKIVDAINDKTFLVKDFKILHIISSFVYDEKNMENHLYLIGGDRIFVSQTQITAEMIEKYDILITSGK